MENNRINQKNKVLVVCAHADDEILGCGGTIARHVVEGDKVLCLIISNHNTSRLIGKYDISYQDLVKSSMAPQAREVAGMIGYKVEFMDCFHDNQFDREPLLKIIQKIETFSEGYNADIIYTHYEHDLNIDHRLTFQSVTTAFRPNGENYSMMSFEVPSSTDWASKTFAPNLYVNVTNYIELKLRAMQVYKTEVREFPHPRSLEAIRALAKIRGVQSGLKYAEAFKVVRMIR